MQGNVLGFGIFRGGNGFTLGAEAVEFGKTIPVAESVEVKTVTPEEGDTDQLYVSPGVPATDELNNAVSGQI